MKANLRDLPELPCTPNSILSIPHSSQKHSQPKYRFTRRLYDEDYSQVKIVQGPRPRHQAMTLPKKKIQQMVQEMPINKLGPSLIPFAVTNKFLSPYKIFRKIRLQELQNHRDVVGRPFQEKAKLVAQEWSKMRVAEKNVYLEMMRECRNEYVNKMSGCRIPFVRKRRGISSRDKTMPERLATPFQAFAKETKPIFEADNPDFDYHEIKDLLQETWDVFDDDQKAYYEQKAKDDKWRYVEEWEAWLRQRFGSINPVEPSKWPQLPDRPLNGYKVYCEMKKKYFMEMMIPNKSEENKCRTQEHEIVGLVQRCWTELSTEDRQIYEEEAQEDIQRFKKEMEEYNKKYTWSIKKTDDTSKEFVVKLRSLEASIQPKVDVYAPFAFQFELEDVQEKDMYESVVDQAILQIQNLRKDSLKLIKKSRQYRLEEFKKSKKKQITKKRGQKLVQRTLYSQVEEMKERLEGGDKKTIYSEDFKEPQPYKKRKTGPNNGPFYEQFDNEEDFLLTHLSEVISRNKKQLELQETQSQKQAEQQAEVEVSEKSQPVSEQIIIEKKSDQSQSLLVKASTQKSSQVPTIESHIHSMDDLMVEDKVLTFDKIDKSSPEEFYENMTQLTTEERPQNYSAALEASQNMVDEDENRVDLNQFIDDCFNSQIVDDDEVMILEVF